MERILNEECLTFSVLCLTMQYGRCNEAADSPIHGNPGHWKDSRDAPNERCHRENKNSSVGHFELGRVLYLAVRPGATKDWKRSVEIRADILD